MGCSMAAQSAGVRAGAFPVTGSCLLNHGDGSAPDVTPEAKDIMQEKIVQYS